MSTNRQYFVKFVVHAVEQHVFPLRAVLGYPAYTGIGLNKKEGPKRITKDDDLFFYDFNILFGPDFHIFCRSPPLDFNSIVVVRIGQANLFRREP
jgi:hypothetical protein